MTAHHHLASPAAYSLAPSATGSPSKMAHHHRQHPGLSKFHRHSTSPGGVGGGGGRTKRGRHASGWLSNQLPVIVLTATNIIIISMLYSDITCHMDRPSLIDNSMTALREEQLRFASGTQQARPDLELENLSIPQQEHHQLQQQRQQLPKQQQQASDSTLVAGTPPPAARRGFYAPGTPTVVLPIQQQEQQQQQQQQHMQYLEGDVLSGDVMQGDVIQRLHSHQQHQQHQHQQQPRDEYLSVEEALGAAVGGLRGLARQGKVVRSMAEFDAQDLPQDPRLVRQRAALGGLGAYSDMGQGGDSRVMSDLPLRREREREGGYWHHGYAEGALAGVQWGGGRGVEHEWQGREGGAVSVGSSGGASGGGVVSGGGAVRATRVKGATGDDDFDEDPASVEYQEVTWQESSLPRVNSGRARGSAIGKQRVGGLGDAVGAWGTEGDRLWRAQHRHRDPHSRGWVHQGEDSGVTVRDDGVTVREDGSVSRHFGGILSGGAGVYQEEGMGGGDGEWQQGGRDTVGALRGGLSHRRHAHSLSHSLSRPQRVLEQTSQEWEGGEGVARAATARHARGLSWGGEGEAWGADTWQGRGGAAGVGARLASVVQGGGGAEAVSTGVDAQALSSSGSASVTSSAAASGAAAAAGASPVTTTPSDGASAMKPSSDAKRSEASTTSSSSSTATAAVGAAATSTDAAKSQATPAGTAAVSATSAPTKEDAKVSEESLWVEAERPDPSSASPQASPASSQVTAAAATKAAPAAVASAAEGKDQKGEKGEVSAAREDKKKSDKSGVKEGKKEAAEGGSKARKEEKEKDKEGKGTKASKDTKVSGKEDGKGKGKGKGRAQMDPAAAAKAAQALFENLPEVKSSADTAAAESAAAAAAGAGEDNGSAAEAAVEINKEEFVLFSGYRSSALAFVAIGLAPLGKLRPSDASTCWWQPKKGKTLQGQVMFKRPAWEVLASAHKEAARKALAQAKAKAGKAGKAGEKGLEGLEGLLEQYEVEVLVCHLEEDADMRTGGQLHMNVSGKDVFVYEEDPSPDRQLIFAAEEAVQFDLMMCSMPLVGKVDETRFMQWFDFHRTQHKVDYFQIYDAGGVHESLLRRLEPYINEGSVSVFDMRAAYKIYSGTVAKALVMNDCLYYARPAAKWALFMDFDEYLHVPQASHSIQAVLAKHKFASHITLGRLNFFTDKCLAPEGAAPSAKAPASTPEWDVEKMVFRDPEVFCGNTTKYANRNLCLEQEGQRKFLVNPRLTNLLSMNKILEPRAGGLNLDASEARLYNYEGITYKDRKVCARQVHAGDWVPQTWSRDHSMAEVAKKARLKDTPKK